ncbi:MAG TPA: aromatic ring-hydroxylating dioxygenase subunit alpha, partial [Marisediminicola sp.]|nr:aromatic ring-hydroxylating dioxygenase subunit alpha [Marisediminicola sp.]
MGHHDHAPAAGRAENLGTNAAYDWSSLGKSTADLGDAQHLPAEVYTSQAVFERERDLLFFRDWIVVGRADEIPDKGDYKTFDFLGEPILICRDGEGNLNAFFNSCRHRGVAVAKGQGNARVFVCPAHSWTYDLKGKLFGVLRPKQIGNFDTTHCELPPVKIDTYAGFIFINLDPQASSLADYLDVDGFRDTVAFLRGDDLMTVDRLSFEIDANWKIVMETLADVYHVEVVHRETFGKASNGYKPQTSSNLTLTKHGATKQYSSPTFAPEGEALFGPMPWLADHPSGRNVALSFYLRPNFAFFGRCDMIQPCAVYPVSPSRSVITCWTCMPKEFASDPDFDRKVKVIADFCRKVNAEDKELILAIQKGLSSRAFPRGPVHELERIVHHRTKAYVSAMA